MNSHCKLYDCTNGLIHLCQPLSWTCARVWINIYWTGLLCQPSVFLNLEKKRDESVIKLKHTTLTLIKQNSGFKLSFCNLELCFIFGGKKRPQLKPKENKPMCLITYNKRHPSSGHLYKIAWSIQIRAIPFFFVI